MISGIVLISSCFCFYLLDMCLHNLLRIKFGIKANFAIFLACGQFIRLSSCVMKSGWWHSAAIILKLCVFTPWCLFSPQKY